MKHPVVRTIVRVCAYALFWSWNVIFLAFMFLGFAPTLLPELINAVRTSTIPVQFLALGAILVVIPLAAVVLGLTVLRRSPGRLLTLGYGIEGPLMLIVAIRFFAVREATPMLTLLFVIAALGLAAFLWQVLDRRVGQRKPFWEYLRVPGLTLLLIMGLYASVWIAFYALPIPVMVWRAIGDLFIQGIWQALVDLSEMGVWWMFLGIHGLILAGYTATLFVVMPIAVPVLYVRAWWRGVRRFAERNGRLRAAALTAAVVLLCAVSVVLAGQQPQHRAFALLETPPASSEEAQSLLGQQETIRDGLLNAYLAPARYVSAVGEVYHIRMLFMEAFDLSEEAAAPFQQAYEVVARPVLYEPVNPPDPVTDSWRWDNRVFREEPVRAAEMYEAFFDESIIDGERETVVRAARSTWSPAQAQAAWQAVDDREVHLVRQEVSVTEYGDWAEVELYEVYQSQKTGQRQEVVYYFSLPESAVVTGVWLGNSADRDARFTYRVAPRGAAQSLYRNEVRYNLDPALVEQIGPRQYRLRIFPVEPQRIRWDDSGLRSTVEEGPEMHMWLTYRTFALADDTWPLPRLADWRNVYWDGASVRLVGGRQMQVHGEEWLPASVPAAAPVEPVAHRVDFPGGQTVVARPVSVADLPGLPDGLRLAVVLDRSRSMAAYEANVEGALAQLAGVAQADVDVYLTASAYRGEGPSRAKLSDVASGDILYYGGQNAAEMLAQFDRLRAGDDYDAVLVLTDGTGYGLGSSGIDVPLPDAPVWMVHLGGAFPLGYDDATLEAIQASGGGVAGSVDEALVRLAVSLKADDAVPYDVVDGYVWQVVPTEVAEGIEVTSDFGALAARRLILAEMVRNRGSLDQLETLDTLHAIAVEHSVVTPYSSMIVLVTEQQQKRLDRLEKEGDRFLREHEDVGETVPETGVTAVPEPEEWLLLVIVAGMLLWYARKRWPDLLRRRAV
ncbi:MAG: TIGR02921 family PEP-CTERM protein [Anaerolineae bacterium]|nr:TIGR02921 family PEP-CTERM protein [Anaerolineae bacterium]